MEGHLTLRLRSFKNNRDDISGDHFDIVFFSLADKVLYAIFF